MKVLEINQEKVFKTKEFLINIIKEPLLFKGNVEVETALRSQRGLASYINKELSIVSCSLNTLKRASDLFLYRGFIELDELRNNAKDAIKQKTIEKKSNHNSQLYLMNKIVILKSQLAAVQKSNFMLATIVEELRSLLEQINSSYQTSAQAKSLCDEYNNSLEAKLFHTFDGDM